MKDKEYILRLEQLEREVGIYATALAELSKATMGVEGVSIKDCPKCEHSVLAQAVGRYTIYSVGYPGYPCLYQCLTCGSKFTCSNECVCKIVEE